MCALKDRKFSGLTYVCASTFLLFVLFSSPLRAEQRGGGKDRSEPIRISSELMETENNSKLLIFKGNVVAVRGDLKITADELRIVNFQDSGKMEKMTAVGNVRLSYKGRMASADKAIYYNSEDKVELTGKPRVWEGDNRISGEVMSLFLRENRSVVKGGKNARVEAIYYPEEK